MRSYAVAIALIGVMSGCGSSPTAPGPLPVPPPPIDTIATLVGAGDIGWCGPDGGPQSTAALLDAIPGTVFAAGDNAYFDGTSFDYARCYDPSWGRHKSRTR